MSTINDNLLKEFYLFGKARDAQTWGDYLESLTDTLSDVEWFMRDRDGDFGIDYRERFYSALSALQDVRNEKKRVDGNNEALIYALQQNNLYDWIRKNRNGKVYDKCQANPFGNDVKRDLRDTDAVAMMFVADTDHDKKMAHAAVILGYIRKDMTGRNHYELLKRGWDTVYPTDDDSDDNEESASFDEESF